MKRVIPKWCKRAQIKMINNDISVNELAKAVGFSRQYTSGILNGRVMTDSAVSRISEYLKIPEIYD